MGKYLLQSAYEMVRSDGLGVTAEQALRYLALYGSPVKIARYWGNRLLGRNEQTIPVQGSLMRLDLRDRGIHADLFLHGIREPQATKEMQRILRPEWTVVDIGANIGYYVLQEATRVKWVYAIEPGPDNFRNLARNVGLNGYSNVEMRQVAIGDHDGLVGFELSKASNWNKIARHGAGDLLVELTTLDKFLDGKKVDFVRMDVEGYEMSILNGMEITLRESRPDMFIEVHRDLLRDYGWSQLEVMCLLAKYDYSVSKSFIQGREGPTGKIRNLLENPTTRALITEKGIASHIFFSGRDQ